jgi:hypothetical protein
MGISCISRISRRLPMYRSIVSLLKKLYKKTTVPSTHPTPKRPLPLPARPANLVALLLQGRTMPMACRETMIFRYKSEISCIVFLSGVSRPALDLPGDLRRRQTYGIYKICAIGAEGGLWFVFPVRLSCLPLKLTKSPLILYTGYRN